MSLILSSYARPPRTTLSSAAKPQSLAPRFGHTLLGMAVEGGTMGLGMGVGMRILDWLEHTSYGGWVKQLFSHKSA